MLGLIFQKSIKTLFFSYFFSSLYTTVINHFKFLFSAWPYNPFLRYADFRRKGGQTVFGIVKRAVLTKFGEFKFWSNALLPPPPSKASKNKRKYQVIIKQILCGKYSCIIKTFGIFRDLSKNILKYRKVFSIFNY